MNYIPSIELNAAENLDFEKNGVVGAPTPCFIQKTFRNQSSNNTSLHNIDSFQDSHLPLDNQKKHLKPSTFANKSLSTLNKIEFVGTFDDLNVIPPQLPSAAYLSQQKLPTDPERSSPSSQENKDSLRQSERNDPQDQTHITINVEDASPAMDQNLVSSDQVEGREIENPERGEKARNVISQALEVYFILTVTYSLSLLSLQERIPYVTLLWFLLVVCVFQTVRTLIQSFKAEEPNVKSEKVFKVLDWIAFSVLAVLALGKNYFGQIMLWPAVVSGIMSTVIYWIFAARNDFFIKKGGMVFIKLVFWSQILLIALKLDSVVTTWLYVFVLIYYILVFFMSISIGIFILTLAYLWQNFSTINSNHTALGLLWDFLNTLFSWIWGFIILNLTDKLQEGESSLLNTFLLIGLVHSTVLSLYTLLFKRSLAEYMQTALEAEGEEQDQPNTNPAKSTFQVVKGHIPYLVRVSPTYFIMSSEKGKAKDSKQQNQQLKHQIFDAKMHKHQMKLESSNKQLEILGKIMPQSVKETHKKTKSYAFTHRGQNYLPAASKNKDIQENEVNPDFLPNLCYSRDDADIIKDLPGVKNLNESVGDADEKQCIVCFSNPQNAVFMNCGHGGVCYECALESWKRDNGCLLCRNPIDEVLKVALFPGIDVVKVLEGTKKSIILD